MTGLPKDYNARKALPVYDFLVGYFPDAFVELVKVAVVGNEQHNPGEPLHWARGKSMDQLNTALRHMMDHGAGTVFDDDPNVPWPDGRRPAFRTYHLAKAAWRLLAALQLLCEEEATPHPTKRAELAAIAGIDASLSAEDAWRAADKAMYGKPSQWFALDRSLGVTSAGSIEAYHDALPTMSESEREFKAQWDAP